MRARFLLPVGMLLLSSCREGGAGEVRVTVTPGSVDVIAWTQQTFSASVSGTLEPGVTWSVTGPGAISPQGVYSAPAVPRAADNFVIVRATSSSDPASFADAVVRVVAAPVFPPSGSSAGGTRVTIGGSGFSSGATVRIGGQEATEVDVLNPTTLRATVPAGPPARTVDVEIDVAGVVTVYPLAFRYGAARLRLGGRETFTECATQFGGGTRAWSTNLDAVPPAEVLITCKDAIAIFGAPGDGTLLQRGRVAFPYPAPFAITTSATGAQAYSFAGPRTFRSIRLPDVSLLGERMVTPSVSSAVVADVNADGNGDVLSVDGAGNRVVLVMGTVGGGFASTPETLLASGGFDLGDFGQSSIATLDLDGDLDIDLVVSHQGTAGNHGILVYLNGGAGVFAAPVRYAMAGSVGSAPVGDFDGDGAADVWAGTQWRRGNGDGSFAAALTAPASAGGKVVDLDGDGYIDVVSQFGIAYGSPGGPTALVPLPCAMCNSPTPVDLDGTGDLDLIGGGDGQAETMLAAGPRGYSPPRVDPGAPVRIAAVPSTRTLALTASNADPASGALFGIVDPATLVLTTARLPVGSSGDGLRAAGAGVVVIDGGGAAAGDGAVWHVPDPTIPTSAVRVALGRPATDAVLGDFDGDGFADIAATTDDSMLWIAWGTLTGFEAPLPVQGPVDPRALSAGDVDGDGRVDLGVRDPGDDAVVLVRAADRTPEVSVLASWGGCGATFGDAFACTIVLSDVDGDGNLDVVAASALNPALAIVVRVSFAFGRGDGTFEPANVVEAGPYHFTAFLSGLHVVDIDGDLLNDVVVEMAGPTYSYTGTAVFRGSPGGFLRTAEYLGSVQGDSEIFDFDGDGLVEVAMPAVRVLRNDSY